MDQLSLSQLQQLLNARSQEAEDIKSDLEQAKALIASCDNRLSKICGTTMSHKGGVQKPLKIFVKNVLNTSNEPLTVREIAELVLEAGYKTASVKNFRNIVQQVLLADAEFKRKTRPKARPARYSLEEV